MSELRFDGQVAIVTGAGGGLGRSHALLLASRGARVVVNDLGGSHTGEGESQKAADQVVAEIKEAGGEAVANYDSVEFGDKIVQTAIDTYGRIDIVINNAGILRDVSFHKMSDEDWELINKVHVYGSYSVTKAAWPFMRQQKYGRVIMTASAAGIYGNFGQANYSTAKLGLVGFSNTLAIEGARKNIHVNTIAPIAGSRMTETVLPGELLDALKPEYVSALVAALCHESCEESGGLYEVGGGFYSKLRWERTEGKTFRLGRSITPEDIQRHMDAITSFKESTHPGDVMASMQPIMMNVEAGPSRGGNEFIDVDQALGYTYPEKTMQYDERDVSLYALGVGAANDPLSSSSLQYVYEMHDSGMKVLPTFAVIPGLNTLMDLAKEGNQAPGLNYGFDRILHGEQKTIVHRPLPTSGTLTNQARIKNIFDKGKHALIVTEVQTLDESGECLATNEITTLVRGAGGWGGDRGPSNDANPIPERAPDHVVEEHIPANQALLYRLSGDWNPLHADPGMAQAFGFDKPILHGLCTFGYAGRHVINTYAKDQNPDYFKSIEVRFADSVFPGETLRTEMWKESEQRIVFRCIIKERDSVVISNASIELYEELPTTKKAPQAIEAPNQEEEKTFGSWDVFMGIKAYIAQHPELVKRTGYVFSFELANPTSSWTIDLKNEPGAVHQGSVGKADCTLKISDADFMEMSSGKADPMKLFTTGKLKISGNVMASQKLEFLQKIDKEQAMAAAKDARASGESAQTNTASEATDTQQKQAPAIFAALQKALKRGAYKHETTTTLAFRLQDQDATWWVTLTPEGGSVQQDTNTESTDTTLTLDDATLVALVQGEFTAQQAYTRGQMRVDGHVQHAHQLPFLLGLLQ